MHVIRASCLLGLSLPPSARTFSSRLGRDARGAPRAAAAMTTSSRSSSRSASPPASDAPSAAPRPRRRRARAIPKEETGIYRLLDGAAAAGSPADGRGVTVAVLDTGCDLQAAGLRGTTSDGVTPKVRGQDVHDQRHWLSSA